MFYYNNSMEKNGEAFLRSVATGLVHKHTSTVTQGRRNLLKVGGGRLSNKKGHLKFFSGHSKKIFRYITSFPKYEKKFPDIPKNLPDI